MEGPLLTGKWAQRKLFADDRRMHFMIQNDFANNGNDGEMMLQNTRWSIGSEWRLGYNNMHGYETETHIGRFIGRMQWFMPFIGFDWRYRKLGHNMSEKNLFGQINTKDNRSLFSAGFNYTLPMLVKFQTEVFTNGDIRMQLMREDIPVAKKLRAAFMVNTDKEYMVSLNWDVIGQLGRITIVIWALEQGLRLLINLYRQVKYFTCLYFLQPQCYFTLISYFFCNKNGYFCNNENFRIHNGCYSIDS
jgi:hypothetical protein